MPQLLGQRAQRVLAVAPVEVRAGHDHRPLGLAQQRRGALDRVAVGAGAAAGAAAASALARLLRLDEDVVQREVEERRARSAASSRRAARRRPARGSRPSTRGVAASFVSGRTNGTWSISCSEPWPQRIAGARPPSTSIGELF